MGEVYRAHDTRLGRQVAIKVLPFALATDSERLRRFEQEARAAAALNHPNILALHDIGQHDGAPYIVTELLEGVTLRERLASGSLPVRKAVEHAVQVANGLAAAHEKGIVHRDLKPENIFVTDDGHVKILDFGLAKLTHADAAPAAATAMPTSPAKTAAGLVLGTMGYISPEQLRGLPADHRSDIFAFGAVLYEMLAGRRAFPGETSADTISAILKEDPLDLPVSDHHIPPALVRIVDRCLEKTPSARFQSVSDLGFALEALSSPFDAIPATAALAPSGTGAMRDRLALTLFSAAALVAVLATIVVGVVAWNRSRPASALITRFAVTPSAAPAGSTFLVDRQASSLSSQAVSRDGTRLAIVADGRPYLRNLNEMEVRPFSAAFFAITQPVFSPDGTWLLYVEGPIPAAKDPYVLMKAPLAGGNAVQVAGRSRQLQLDVTWETEETILYANPDGIMRVSANGGMPEILVKSREGEVLGCPRILPGGAWVMFCSTKAEGANRWDSADILVQSMESDERRPIWKGGSDARYVRTGHIVYAQGNKLFAVPFDVGELRVTGSPVPIVEGVRRPFGGLSGTADFSVSDTGTLAYVSATVQPATPLSALALVDMSGVVKKLNLSPAEYRGPQLAPDGRQLAVEIVTSDGRRDVWVYNMSGESAPRQLTQGGNSGHPIWLRDSRRVTFESTRDGRSGIYSQSADGSGIAERLTIAEAEGDSLIPESWSPDGRTLSFSIRNTVWTLSLDKGAKPVMLVGGKDAGASAVFSPDGRWLAYRENRRSGTPGQPNEQIYIERFPATGKFYRVSQVGGAAPLWSPDGRRLFYRSGIAGTVGTGRRLMVVEFIALEPFPRWNERVLPIKSFEAFLYYRDYDITPDGKQLLIIVPAEPLESNDAQRVPVNVVLNWTAELKRLVPAN
jgi:Tol biopolymer transport system component